MMICVICCVICWNYSSCCLSFYGKIVYFSHRHCYNHLYQSRSHSHLCVSFSSSFWIVNNRCRCRYRCCQNHCRPFSSSSFSSSWHPNHPSPNLMIRSPNHPFYLSSCPSFCLSSCPFSFPLNRPNHPNRLPRCRLVCLSSCLFSSSISFCRLYPYLCPFLSCLYLCPFSFSLFLHPHHPRDLPHFVAFFYVGTDTEPI